MPNRLALFADRDEAGRRLAAALEHFRDRDPVVIALPRGGVPVAFEVARLLGAPLDVLVVRKIGAPFNPEYGIGAIAEGGFRFFRRDDHELIGVSTAELEAVVQSETTELERRRLAYRGDREPLSVEGRTVILVDDGVATGGTAIVAAAALRARGATEIVLAVPVGPPGTERRLASDFDEVVCLEQPDGFAGVGRFYIDFSATSDAEVVHLLGLGRDVPPLRVTADPPADPVAGERTIEIEPEPNVLLEGDLRVPLVARGLVIFSHGAGSSRKSPRNRAVAEQLNEAGFATLLLDLLTPIEAGERANVFDIGMLAARLMAATRWIGDEEDLRNLPVFYFGASTGAAAALRAAAHIGAEIHAVVSRGGRPDLAADALDQVRSPTLLIVGGADWQVLGLNEQAAERLRCRHQIAIVPGAGHLFEEPGALDLVAQLAAEWFSRFLSAER
ncbi:MAG: dienelactone hydrolase family protein [Actinobacteria bacterium]|nr:dienelactone hydrolase family protein [Actinomycetota bacterium]